MVMAYKAAIDNVREALAKPSAEPLWTHCSEQMPPEDRAVLIFSEDVGYAVGYAYDGALRDTRGPLDPDCAWWTPLPDSPKEKQK